MEMFGTAEGERTTIPSALRPTGGDCVTSRGLILHDFTSSLGCEKRIRSLVNRTWCFSILKEIFQCSFYQSSGALSYLANIQDKCIARTKGLLKSLNCVDYLCQDAGHLGIPCIVTTFLRKEHSFTGSS